MKSIFVTDIIIENVRHLKNITIPLSQDKFKHLILTGKNGSGKTSVLQAISSYLNAAAASDRLLEAEECGVLVDVNVPVDNVRYHFEKGEFILAYYKAERTFRADVPKHVEKIDLKENYHINEFPGQLFVKYLLDLKVTEALARNNGKIQKAEGIKEWFNKLQDLLRKIFDDDSLELIFEEDSYSFLIKEKNREIFDFNSLSSGFAAVLDIVLDIIIRMEKITNRSFDFNVPGIVLIDEIETHLHLDMQKSILHMLTTIFPNIQFIISTHSPFILNSLDNVVIYDLENNIMVENSLTNVPYDGIVKGYFKCNTLSNDLQEKFKRYKELVNKNELTDDDFEEIAELELFLNEIPDYLALDISTEYKRIKMEFESREDV